MDNDKYFYTITVFDKLDLPTDITKKTYDDLLTEENIDFNRNHYGDIWVCGLYKSEEEAIAVVEGNITDIHEGCYGYALVEEYNYGLYPLMSKCHLYKWDKEMKAYLPYNHGILNCGFQGLAIN